MLGIGGVGQVDAQLLGALQGQVQVLLVQVDAEARVEGALDHALGMHLEDFRRGKATHQRFTHLGRVGAVLGGEQQRFADSLDIQGDDDLVGHLGGLAVTVATHAGDVLAHGLEQWQGALEGVRAAANHDAQGGGLGTYFATGHRGVQVGSAGGLDFFGEGFGGGRGDRAHVDHHLVRAHAFGHAVVTEQHAFHLWGVRHHDDDELGFLGHFFRVGQGHCTGGDQVGWRGVVVGGNENAVPCFLQVLGHGLAHDAGADETDFSHENMPLCICGVSSCGSGHARETGDSVDGTGYAGVRGQARSHRVSCFTGR